MPANGCFLASSVALACSLFGHTTANIAPRPGAIAAALAAGCNATRVKGWEPRDYTTASSMCNLYSITTNQAAIIALFRVINRYVGNLPPMPGVYPDFPAPVVRNTEAGRELSMMRWGMPPPPRTGEAAGHQHPQHVCNLPRAMMPVNRSLRSLSH